MPRPVRLRRSVCRALATSLVLLCGLSGSAMVAGSARAADGSTSAVQTQDAMVPVGAEPGGAAVSLDTTTFAPTGDGSTKHPAVLLAHGFGGSKADLVTQGKDLAAHGYVVLTYSARGFAKSGGFIHLDDPAYEIADARTLVDLLATRPDVLLDAPGDPRVGVFGPSYGGGLALMLGATDKRVDAVAAAITWNDLADTFFPQNALATTPPATGSPADVERASNPGPFKQLWASRFFLGTAAAGASVSPTCGRFDPTVCRLFLTAAQTGRPSAELLTLLHAHSVKPLIGGLTAPTYLVQGMADSLFGVEQSDATARALQTQGTPVAVRWMDGGHDGTSTTAADDLASVTTWLSHYLDGAQKPTATPLPIPTFVYANPLARRATSATLSQTSSYPDAATWSTTPIDGATKPVLNPPGGQPASVTIIPGLGTLAATLPAYQLAALPTESAAFDTPAFADSRTIVGTPRVRLTVTSTGPTATLFLSLWQVTTGTATLPRQVVSPVTVATTPGTPTTVDVALPGGTWNVPAGSSLRVLVTSTDSSYAAPTVARADRVAVADLQLPAVAGTAVAGAGGGTRDSESIGVLVAIAVVALGLIAAALWRRRTRQHTPHLAELADVPLVVDHLVKTYSDGHRAVDDVSWRAERGQVVGLLGPNGAGKTTTLRLVMGLIRPDSGVAHVLGEPVSAGSPVLARVGALIEGPGFLPHLTGRQNLHAYWAATGRDDADAAYDEVLAVAALGGAVDRPVRSYSQGMRQRLGIAQAMLGLPEVLILDEPTNGLDPPQIAAMRPILHRYAAAGRTVVVSSHLLAEVEMTCSHVVVMHAGRVVTTGTVAELVDSSDTTVVQLGPGSDVVAAAVSLRAVDGVTKVEVTDDPVEPRLVVTADLTRADVVRAVANTGVDIVGISSRRHLEEVFLSVIAGASGGAPESTGGDSTSLTDRLRQVRSR
ncbi:alpha/beta fold hydrolase [Lapillicoccus sp.]|uniref:alpha/beta fold hydrolase n=1 Tax=Lapillicoccus sp. TaxID=1909287 RepID=UPI0025F74FBC|nr:alpha/beta fold hydrolase [Lapillicoccus sp.]